jgi:hypothetical protein
MRALEPVPVSLGIRAVLESQLLNLIVQRQMLHKNPSGMLEPQAAERRIATSVTRCVLLTRLPTSTLPLREHGVVQALLMTFLLRFDISPPNIYAHAAITLLLFR